MTSTSSSKYDFLLHPYLTTPSLFIGPLPNHVLQENIKNIFKNSHPGATISFSRSKNRRNRGAPRPRVEFPDLNSAERALATLHLRPIPNIDPPVVLKFSTTPTFKPLEVPDASVSPRVMKALPAGCTETALYDLLRPYGPLYSVRIDPVAGGLVQFWSEADAEEAEICEAPNLSAYDPCSLFCSNISFDIDAVALRTHFAEFGRITSAEIFTHAQTGKVEASASSHSCFQLKATHKAMAAMHGAEIQWRTISVTYRVLKKGRKTADTQHRRPIVTVDVPPNQKEAEPLPPTPPTEPTPAKPAVQTNVESAGAHVSRLNRELKSLQDLYAVEVKERAAAEAESAHLRDELDAVKRALEMAESRLKIVQLESDRPLWEEAKKKREENERAERTKEEERRRAAELKESRRKMREFQEQERERKRVAAEAERAELLRREAEEKARRDKEEQERKARQQEERERKAKAAREQREREKRWRAATKTEEARCQKRDEQMWGVGVWTDARALERLKVQMDEFERIKFSEAQPLTFHVIPWPVLVDPLDLDVEQINWEAVEFFFARAKAQMAGKLKEYGSLVEKVHRMFHPGQMEGAGRADNGDG